MTNLKEAFGTDFATDIRILCDGEARLDSCSDVYDCWINKFTDAANSKAINSCYKDDACWSQFSKIKTMQKDSCTGDWRQFSGTEESIDTVPLPWDGTGLPLCPGPYKNNVPNCKVLFCDNPTCTNHIQCIKNLENDTKYANEFTSCENDDGCHKEALQAEKRLQEICGIPLP